MTAGAGRRVLLLGVGNTLRGDDGVGYCLVKAVEACGGVEGADTAAVQMLNPGHFDLLEGYSHVVFVDAYVDPEAPRGSRVVVLGLDPRRLSEEDVAEIVQNTDPHGMDPIRLIVMAYAAGVFHGTGTLGGIIPERIEFMEGLSPDVVEAAAGPALRELAKALEEAGARLRADQGCVRRWLVEHCKQPLLD